MAVSNKYQWHALAPEEVLEKLESSSAGLSTDEAQKRIQKFGANELPHQKPYSKLRLLLNQFNNPLMFILFGTIAVSMALKHYSDTAMIVIVMLANTLVGFYQENKANNSINHLKKLVRISTRVLRDGLEKEIDSDELVPGDVIILHAGSKIAADARLIEAHDFKTVEASLTGESSASEKRSSKLPVKTVLADRGNMVFTGTIAEEGFARAVVVETGLATEMGKIVSLLSETDEPKTPLQIQMARLAKIAASFVIFIILIILGIGLLRYESSDEILLASLSLAVSAIPSGLLPAITVILVLGMRRILRQKGLVRKLVSTETLGSVTVICTDKTGTLTEGKMAVTHFIGMTQEVVDQKLNDFRLTDTNPLLEPIKQLARIAVLNNDAILENPQAAPDQWVIRGKITEQALLRAGIRMGFDKKVLEQEFLLLDKIYFSSDLKYSATLRAIDEERTGLYVIGAPEVILKHAINGDNPKGPKFALQSKEFAQMEKRIEELARQGLRVLAGAYVEFNERPKYKNLKELMGNLTMVGLIALEDPVRSEVVDAISVTKRAGIRTAIVTGDHKFTALAVAKKLGLEADETQILEGQDLETISDEELRKRVQHVLIYARVTPQHKLRIVDALQSHGEIVAMVGDGVNDAPALKSADIGVAVNSGTDVAKEVADLILLDNGFHTIVKAVEQGRISLANIRKVFIYLVTDDFSELFIFLASLIVGLPIPLMPAQILWINLVEDGLPDLALTTEQETAYIMDRPPHKHGEPILTKPFKKWLVALFLITGSSAFFLYFAALHFVPDLERVRTMVFAMMGLDSLIFAFSIRSFHKTIFRRDIFQNKLLVIAASISLTFLMLAIYTPGLQKLLSTTPLTMYDWLAIILVSSTEIVLIEISKKLLVSHKV